MTITLNKKQIADVCKAVNMVIARKTTLPVLEHVLIAVTAQNLVKVAVTDLEQTLTISVETESIEGISGAEKFLMPHAELKSLSKTLKKNDTVAIEPTADGALKLTVTTAGNTLTRNVATMPADEYPSIPEETTLPDCDIGAFISAYRDAAFAASTDISRSTMLGIYADVKEKALVGTDGRRLSKKPLTDFPFESEAIFPVTKPMLKLLPDSCSGQMGLHTEVNSDDLLEMRTENLRYLCKCMPGKYPAYDRVIPGDVRDFKTILTFSDESLDAVKIFMPQLKNDTNRMLFVKGQDKGVAAGIDSVENGSCALALPNCTFEGPEAITFAVNCEFLQDALNHKFREVRIQDNRTPLYFENSDESIHLLMPLRDDPSKALAQELDSVLDQMPETEVVVTEPEPEQVQVVETEVEPQAEPETPVEPEAEVQQTAPVEENKGFKMVEKQDPAVRLEELIAESQEAVKTAQDAVKELKKQARLVKKHYRDREKDIASREKEMEKNLDLISRLQQSIAA